LIIRHRATGLIVSARLRAPDPRILRVIADGDSPRWIPHVTVCYSTAYQAMTPIIAALGPQQRECRVQIATVSLVIQHGPERLWDWRTVGAVHLPAPAKTQP